MFTCAPLFPIGLPEFKLRQTHAAGFPAAVASPRPLGLSSSACVIVFATSPATSWTFVHPRRPLTSALVRQWRKTRHGSLAFRAAKAALWDDFVPRLAGGNPLFGNLCFLGLHIRLGCGR